MLAYRALDFVLTELQAVHAPTRYVRKQPSCTLSSLEGCQHYSQRMAQVDEFRKVHKNNAGIVLVVLEGCYNHHEANK